MQFTVAVAYFMPVKLLILSSNISTDLPTLETNVESITSSKYSFPSLKTVAHEEG